MYLKLREREMMKMPNYIYNTIKFKKEDSKKFFQYLDQGNFDFDKLVKMPKEFEKMGGDHGEVEGIAKEWEEFTKDVQITSSNVDEYIGKFRNAVKESPEKYPKSAETVNLVTMATDWGGTSVPNFQYQMYRTAGKVKYGFSSWYGWSVKNWGTKWNAYETDYGEDYLFFQTAWNAPVPIFQRLAELNPNTWFQVKYYDEDTGSNCGIIEYRPGFFLSEDEVNMAAVRYDDETGKLEIIETGFFENINDASKKFNAIIAINSHGTFLYYNDWTDYRRFYEKLTEDEEKEYFRKWYLFADGDLEELENSEE